MTDDKMQAMAYSTALSIVSNTGVTTPEAIRDAAETGAGIISRAHGADVDVEQVVRELEAALNVFQADPVALVDDEGHMPWLDERRGEITWAFSERYLRYLRETENRPPAVLDRLDRLTLRILSHLEDPTRQGEWDRRGLVVGQVQSGKTGNYVGLSCRAADAGYGLIVVLAGLHNSLRSQTQLRLDEGFLGFDTQKRQRADAVGDFAAAAIGVGRLYGARRLPVASLTTSEERGDFLASRARSNPLQLGTIPVLLVVKKHAGILDKLTSWVIDTAGLGDPPKVRDFALLLLDDEADNASISTANPMVDGSYRPEDVNPTRVNEAIRSLLMAFERRVYVGYTATPNANIYIPHDVVHKTLGSDLFPRHFIEYVPPPSNYLGPARVFGLDAETSDPPSLIRVVTDHATWMPDRHKKEHRPDSLPASLREAIRAFILARAVRLARGHGTAHNSMLIHVTVFQDVQEVVRRLVQDELDDVRGRLRFGDGAGPTAISEFRSLWETDFAPTMGAYAPSERCPAAGWTDVEAQLVPAVEPIETRLVNGAAKEALEYFERRDTGFNVITIGGAKLSRGMTLEGLTVSYYLRAARAHDTLLQMGRWFGYRDQYEDVCRLYTSGELLDAFRGVSEANQELIDDFVDMAEQGRTPIQYGLKVRDTVAGMLVTARNKMRGAVRRRIGFSGEGPETVVFHCDKRTAEQNLSATEAFVTQLLEAGAPAERSGGNLVWSGVPGELVAERFFRRYRSPATAWKVQGDAIADYIDDRVAADELTDWTVVLASSSEAKADRHTIAGLRIGLFVRGVLRGTERRVGGEGKYSIKLLRSPLDEATDLDKAQKERAFEITMNAWQDNPGKRSNPPEYPVGWAIRQVRPVTKGLLVIYPLKAPPVSDLEPPAVDVTTGPIVGFVASFPHSPDAPTIEYQVNRVYMEMFAVDPEDEEG